MDKLTSLDGLPHVFVRECPSDLAQGDEPTAVVSVPAHELAGYRQWASGSTAGALDGLRLYFPMYPPRPNGKPWRSRKRKQFDRAFARKRRMIDAVNRRLAGTRLSRQPFGNAE